MHIKDLLPWAHKDEVPRAKDEDEHPVAELQRDMNRVFENFWTRFENPFAPAGLSAGASVLRSDVVETEDAVEVSVELPGLSDDDMEVTLTGDSLTIKGEKRIDRRDEKKGYYISERSYGIVQRTIPLPPGVASEKAEATMKDGVLTVRLPYSEDARSKTKRVEVKTA